MDYHDDKITLGSLRQRFYDRRKELELLDDTIGEAFGKRAIPITIALSVSTYGMIQYGFLKNNGLRGLMGKYLGCMVAGVAISLIGIRSDYHDKLAIFYTSQRYENLNRIIQARWREKKIGESDSNKKFVKPNHLNLDFDRPHFEGIDTHYQSIEASQKDNEIKKYVTYEELQRKNREQYAIKHTKYS